MVWADTIKVKRTHEKLVGMSLSLEHSVNHEEYPQLRNEVISDSGRIHLTTATPSPNTQFNIPIIV